MPKQIRKLEGLSSLLVPGAREVLGQVASGRDFEAPAQLLKSVRAPQAVALVPGCPYSIATNVAHADIWNRVWLGKLEGAPSFTPWPDFPQIDEEAWDATRQQFLANFERAVLIANSDPFVHAMKSDDGAAKTLMQIAVHSSYHLGQVKLIKRILWACRGTKHVVPADSL